MTLDAASVHVCISSGAASARRTAKAIARLAHLPMLELYGAQPIHRPAERLDLSLRETLATAGPSVDPGGPPAGLTASRGPDGLVVVVAPPPRPLRPLLAIGAAAAVVCAGVFVVDRVIGVVGLLSTAAGVFLMLWLGRTLPARLLVEPEVVRWQVGEREESIDVAALEMTRTNDATLVLVGRDDEVRCELPSPEAAEWAARAVEHALGPQAPGYR